MMKKHSKEEMEKRNVRFNRLIDGIINGTTNIPNNSLIMDSEMMPEIMTKKRLELLRLIEHHHPKSINELAGLAKRKKQAVDRDLKMLERFELVRMQKIGRIVLPRIRRKLVILGVEQGDKNYDAAVPTVSVVADKK